MDEVVEPDCEERALSKYALKQQQLIVYKKSKEVEDCSVCLGALKPGTRVLKLACKHTFHTKCIEQWFKKAHVCPNCRHDLEKESIFPFVNM